MDTFDLLSQYNINGEDPLGALYDQDPIFLADGDAALWINGCWAWPNLKEAGASDSDEYGFIPYVLGMILLILQTTVFRQAQLNS